MKIKEIFEEQEKKKICESIVHSLPDWFDVAGKKNYPEGVGETLLLAYFEGEKAVGFISIKENNPSTSEIYVTGVLQEFQGKGIGGKLLAAACARLVEQKKALLAVKTLDASAEYEPYDRTRNFYVKNGFLPVDCYPQIWNEENPCLVMVKILAGK